MRRKITPKNVGQYFDSPYPLNDSGIELNTETECRTSWQPTSRVTPESPNFQELGQNSQGPSVQHMYIPKTSLKRILLIWVLFALIGCSLIVMTCVEIPRKCTNFSGICSKCNVTCYHTQSCLEVWRTKSAKYKRRVKFFYTY